MSCRCVCRVVIASCMLIFSHGCMHRCGSCAQSLTAFFIAVMTITDNTFENSTQTDSSSNCCIMMHHDAVIPVLAIIDQTSQSLLTDLLAASHSNIISVVHSSVTPVSLQCHSSITPASLQRHSSVTPVSPHLPPASIASHAVVIGVVHSSSSNSSAAQLPLLPATASYILLADAFGSQLRQ